MGEDGKRWMMWLRRGLVVLRPGNTKTSAARRVELVTETVLDVCWQAGRSECCSVK